MSELTKARLTVAEAAFVAGLDVRDIDREIDARIIDSIGKAERRVRGAELFYLAAIKDIRTLLAPALRRHMRDAIIDAADAHRDVVSVHRFVLRLDGIRQDLAGPFEALERSKHEHVESRPDVLGGEPVLKGTRIAARHVADLIRHGASRAEIGDDLDLTEAQIEAALIFDQTSPKRGRPTARRKQRTVHVSAA